jgi:Domain of unknown function (DUF1330)
MDAEGGLKSQAIQIIALLRGERGKSTTLVGYAPFEVLNADQDERVEGVVIAEFPPFERTVEWFNGDAYVQARKDRTEGNEYLGILVDSGVAPISKRSAGTLRP